MENFDLIMKLPIKIQLPDCFWDEEVRSGFVVSKKQKKIWAVELDLINEFDRVCKKYDIKYFAFAGTLLGAIRHKGFIPWDDDLDVAMSRRDFKRLCRVASEFEHPYFFQTALTDRRCYFPYARLRNSLTTACITGNATADYNNGIYIDIHPLDGCPNSRFGECVHRGLMLVTRKLCTAYTWSKTSNSRVGRAVAFFLFPILHVLPYSFWVSLHDAVNAMFTPFSNTVDLRTHFDFGLRYQMPKRDLRDLTVASFETVTIPVPTSADLILRNSYGDYMKFPPVSERGKWHEGQVHFEPEIPYTEYLKNRGSKD